MPGADRIVRIKPGEVVEVRDQEGGLLFRARYEHDQYGEIGLDILTAYRSDLGYGLNTLEAVRALNVEDRNNASK